MGVRHLALAVIAVAGMCVLAERGIAIELGELQAVPGGDPPFIFRLTILPKPLRSSDIPAVTVRQPHDALTLVKHNHLELRLRSLTDVELEVRQGGQTFNRLLPKSELRAARARLEGAEAPYRPQPARAKSHESPPAEARPPTTAAAGAPDRALLEREIQEIRREMQNLVGGVTRWQGPSPPAWPGEEPNAIPVPALMLWALLIAGMASLVTGYLMQRRAVNVERRQRRSLAASRRRPRGQLRLAAASLQAVPPAQRPPSRPDALVPVTVLRHVRVSQRTRRRIRVWGSSGPRDATRAGAAEHSRVAARVSRTKSSAPAEIIEALGHLRRELISLQQKQLASATLESLKARMGRAAR
jgi:hypothetical protein